MARPLRLEFAGACWYVIGRALPRRELFRDDVDRAAFLAALGKVAAMLRWNVSGYSLLRNQYQLILETPEPNLGRGMRQLNGVYTQDYNRRHGRAGGLLHGRFKSVLVEKEAHLADLSRFVTWTPVAEGLARTPADWKWSSFRVVSGLTKSPEWIEADSVLELFGRNRRSAREKWKRFVLEGRGSGYDPAKHVRGQVFLGSEEFRTWAASRAAGKAGRGRASAKVTGIVRPGLREILEATAEAFGTTEKELRRRRRGEGRKAFAYVARRDGAHTLPEIGRVFGIREFSASHMASEGERLYQTDAGFRRAVDRARARLGVV